jgi:TolB-like protein
MRLSRLIPLLVILSIPAIAAPGPQEAKKAVAVLRFDNNTGDDRYEHLGRALAAMMISDLSVVEEIQLVERERLEELMNEMDLQQSGYADPSTAVTVGMITGAQFVVTGAFATMEPQMRLDTRVAEVATSEIVKTADVSGQTDSLFHLQQQLADDLLDGLAIVLTEEDRGRLRAQQESNRIDDIETTLAFAQALCLVDTGYYVEALEQMQSVRDAAPGSGVVGLTLEHLRSRAASEARDRVESRASRAIGGLLGRRRAPERESRPPSGC